MMKNYGIPVASEGWPFIIPLAIVTGLLFAIGWKNTAYVSLVLTLFVLYFFRDPDRTVPQGAGVVVSPADGRVIVVKDIFEPSYLEVVKYNPGKFHVASVDKASLDNEQTAMVISDGGRKVLVKQIAGLIARRIVCYAKPGDDVRTGERYGLIRFGSRVDIFLPRDAELRVKVGDRVTGARDIIAVLK
jgi:phosphatidylserine decarboxylase